MSASAPTGFSVFLIKKKACEIIEVNDSVIFYCCVECVGYGQPF